MRLYFNKLFFSDVRDKNVVPTTTVTNNCGHAPQAMTSQTNRRHMVAVTQFILITVVYVISFLPVTLSVNDFAAKDSIIYLYYINHLSNFFIYLAVNKEFRGEAKNRFLAVWETMRRLL